MLWQRPHVYRSLQAVCRRTSWSSAGFHEGHKVCPTVCSMLYRFEQLAQISGSLASSAAAKPMLSGNANDRMLALAPCAQPAYVCICKQLVIWMHHWHQACRCCPVSPVGSASRASPCPVPDALDAFYTSKFLATLWQQDFTGLAGHHVCNLNHAVV